MICDPDAKETEASEGSISALKNQGLGFFFFPFP